MPSSKGKRKSVPVKKAAPAAKPKKVPTCKGATNASPHFCVRPSAIALMPPASLCLSHARGFAEDFIQKGAKLPKDEKAPSAKTSAYMYFSKAQRAKMAKKPESQQLDFTSAGTAIGKAWTALTDKQKVPFENQAKDDADRYDAEMKKYKPSAKFTAELEACKKNPKYQQKLKKVRARCRAPAATCAPRHGSGGRRLASPLPAAAVWVCYAPPAARASCALRAPRCALRPLAAARRLASI